MSGAVAKLEERTEAAEQEAARLRKMLELVRELGDEGLTELVRLVASDEHNGNGHSNGHANGDGNGTKPTPAAKGPRGREAVRRIVKERPGIWTIREIRDEMVARGWFTSQKGLEAAVKRLCAINGEGRHTGKKGQYVFPANHEEVERESDPSDGAMIPFTPISS